MLPAIILFAKAPIPGNVKTRLASWLGPERAAALHEAFVRDMVHILATLPADLRIASDTVGAWNDLSIPVMLQRGAGLGERMRNAASDALDEGRPSVMLVGSDSPTVPHQHLFSILDSPADVTLGPADDGGFYSICFRRVQPHMFDGVEWSSARTLSMTLCAMERSGLTAALGPAWFDADHPEDLLRLRAAGALPPYTRSWMNAHWSALAPLSSFVPTPGRLR